MNHEIKFTHISLVAHNHLLIIEVLVWGRNSSDEVYYTSCPTSQLDVPGSWSAPAPILTGVERISAYIDKADGGNTVFASGGGKLTKLTQATRTNAKLWRPQEITLASTPAQKPLSFDSYTTAIHVSDADDLPAGDIPLSISTDSRTPLYINGLYYVVGPTLVNVPTDSSGTVTIIEAANGLSATLLTVAIENGLESTIINPMDTPFGTLSELDSVNALKNASYPAQTTAGGVIGDVDYYLLVAPSTIQSDLKTIAARMTNLKDAYDGVKPPSTTTLSRLKPSRPQIIPATLFRASEKVDGIWDAIAIAAGDLFRWLKSGIEAVIDIVFDAASDAWHFIAKIAGEAYRAVLDTVDAIIGAIEWIFNVIKTAIEKLIQFLKFLFSWDDIKRTKDVLHNTVMLYLRHQVDGLGSVKSAFDSQVKAVQKTLNEWARIGDWSPLGTPAASPASSSATNPTKDHTCSSMMFAHHFRSNVGQLTIKDNKSASTDVVQELIDDLLGALSNEGEVLSAVYAKLQEVALNITSMSVADVIKEIAAVLADGLLSSVQVVVDALLDALAALASGAIDLLDTEIHIPVISDILEWIGVPSISILDLFLWIAAVGYDVVYKIINNEAPFPNNSDVSAIISAKSWDELLALFGQTGSAPAILNGTGGQDTAWDWAALNGKALNGTAKLKAQQRLRKAPRAIGFPDAVRKGIHVAGHASAGFSLLMSNFIVGFEAEAITGGNPFSIPSAVLGIMVAALQGGSDALVPSCPVDNAAVSGLSKATTAAVVVSKILFCGPVQSKLGAASGNKFSGLAVGDGRATGAIVNAVLVIPALFITGWHFYELSSKPDSTARTAAILGEVTNLTSYGSRISYALAVNDKDPTSRQIPIVVMLACNVASAGLQTAEAFYG